MKMKRLLLILLASSIVTCVGLHEESRNVQSEVIESKNLSIVILYDNNPYKEGLKTGWGFSCLIKAKKTILFDTGGDGTILLENMEKLGINPEEIDIVVLSHIHGDHVGGLKSVLERNSKVVVYLPKSFPQSFKEYVKKYARVVEVHEPIEICEGIYSTGELGWWIKEQALIVNTDKGLIVITGCAHPGIVKMVKTAKDLLGNDVLLVMGGFHLFSKSNDEILKIVSDFKKLGVRYVAPCHCSGDAAREIFKSEYGENFISAGVGKIIDVNRL